MSWSARSLSTARRCDHLPTSKSRWIGTLDGEPDGDGPLPPLCGVTWAGLLEREVDFLPRQPSTATLFQEGHKLKLVLCHRASTFGEMRIFTTTTVGEGVGLRRRGRSRSHASHAISRNSSTAPHAAIIAHTIRIITITANSETPWAGLQTNLKFGCGEGRQIIGASAMSQPRF
jgi:hypothetical protein